MPRCPRSTCKRSKCLLVHVRCCYTTSTTFGTVAPRRGAGHAAARDEVEVVAGVPGAEDGGAPVHGAHARHEGRGPGPRVQEGVQRVRQELPDEPCENHTQGCRSWNGAVP